MQHSAVLPLRGLNPFLWMDYCWPAGYCHLLNHSHRQLDDSAYDTSSIKLSYCCTVLPENEGAPICAPYTWALAGLSWLYGGSTHDVTHVKSIWIKYLCYKAWGLVWNNNNNKMFLNGRHFLHAALIKTLIFLIITKPWSQSKCCS